MNFALVSIRLPASDKPDAWGHATFYVDDEGVPLGAGIKAKHVSTFAAFQQHVHSQLGIRLAKPPGNWKTLVADAIEDGCEQ